MTRIGMLVLAVGVIALAACVAETRPPIQRSRVVAGSESEILQRFAAAGATVGLYPADGSERPLEGRADAAWVDCQRGWLKSQGDSGQRRQAEVLSTNVRASVSLVRQPGGTEVVVGTIFRQEQMNPFNQFSFTVSCDSTGVLERLLLDGLGAGA